MSSSSSSNNSSNKVLKSLLESLVDSELEEMAIGQFNRVGDFSKAYGFHNKVDRKILTNDKAVEKIKRQWQKTPFQFDMWIMNDSRVKSSDFFEVGEVDSSYVYNQMKLTPEEFQSSEDAISIIFTNNRGDERYMASGWILAHRVGHAFARGKYSTAEAWKEYINVLREIFSNILREVYGINTTKKGFDQESLNRLMHLAVMLGTQKSSRDGNLRNWYEFGYELFAQYLLTGKIKLNPLPDRVVQSIGAFGRKDTRRVTSPEAQETYNRHDLEYFSNTIEVYIESVLQAAVGSIFVM